MIEWIIANAGDLLSAAVQIIGGFAVIATLTPNKADNAIVDMLLRAINLFGGNVGRATNDPNG